MATSNDRSVRLNLLVETLGQENVDNLKTAIAQLGKSGAIAQPELDALSTAIDKIGAESGAIQTLKDLGATSATLGAAEADAAAKLEATATALVQRREATLAATQAQKDANEALITGRKNLDEIAGAIKLLNVQYPAAERGATEYKTALEGLINRQTQQNQALRDLRNGLVGANAELASAKAAQDVAATAQERAVRAAQAAADAIERQAGTLREAQAAARALGIDTSDLAAAEARLVDSYTNAASYLRQQQTLMAQQAQAAAEAAGELRDAAAAEKDFAAALERLNLSQAEQETRQLAAATALLAAEQELAADAAQRATAAALQLQQAQKDEFARQLAFAQGLLSTELDLQRIAAEKAAQADRDLALAQQNAAQAAREAAVAAQQANQQLAAAFGTVGVRSVQSLQLEIAGVRTSMATIAASANVTGRAVEGAFTAGEARIKELEREIRKVTNSLTTADKAANLFKNSLGQIAAGNLIADAVGYLANKVKEMGREFLAVTVQTERTRRGLDAIYKSSTVATAQFEKLRDVATGAGVSVGDINDAFLRFNAAAKGANVPLATTNALFEAVVRSGATLGLSGEAVAGALDALGQMASKGTVSLEELRAQLGDRLPGAMSLAAKGLGITEAQLIKLVESGKLATEDFFPAFAKALNETAGDTNTLGAAWARFTNMLRESAVAVGDAGGLEVLKGLVTALGVAVALVVTPIQAFAEVVGLAGRAVGLFIAGLTTGDFKGAFAAMGEEFDKSTARVVKFQKAVDASINGMNSQAPAADNATAAVQRNTAGIAAAAAEQLKLAAAAGGTNSTFVAQLVQLAENAKITEANVQASEKLLKAKQNEGRAMVDVAQLTGNATKAADAQVLATQANVAASANVLIARQRELAITQQTILAINEEVAKTGVLSGAKAVQLQDLEKILVVQQAEVEQTKASTQQLTAQAAAAQIAADTLGNSSAMLDTYKQAMETTTAVAAVLSAELETQRARLEKVHEGLVDGTQTQADYNAQLAKVERATKAASDANIQAASYEAKYRDALEDTIKSIDRKGRASVAAANVSLAQATADAKHYDVLAQLARANGNEAQAIEFSVLAKYKEIDATRESIRIKNLELDADAKGIEAEIKGIDTTQRGATEKLEELRIRLEVIKAKRIEANASADVVAGIEAEIAAIRNRNNAVTPGIIGGGNTNGPLPSGQRGLGNTNFSETGPRTSDGLFTNKDGSAKGTFTNMTPMDLAKAVADSVGKGIKYTEADIPFLLQAMKQAQDASQFIGATSKQSAGAVSGKAFQDTQGLLVATKNALDQAQADKKRNAQYIVQVNLNGKDTSLGMNDQKSADDLASLLSGLGQASRTAA